jgi:hypothetical protein
MVILVVVDELLGGHALAFDEITQHLQHPATISGEFPD